MYLSVSLFFLFGFRVQRFSSFEKKNKQICGKCDECQNERLSIIVIHFELKIEHTRSHMKIDTIKRHKRSITFISRDSLQINARELNIVENSIENLGRLSFIHSFEQTCVVNGLNIWLSMILRTKINTNRFVEVRLMCLREGLIIVFDLSFLSCTSILSRVFFSCENDSIHRGIE